MAGAAAAVPRRCSCCSLDGVVAFIGVVSAVSAHPCARVLRLLVPAGRLLHPHQGRLAAARRRPLLGPAVPGAAGAALGAAGGAVAAAGRRGAEEAQGLHPALDRHQHHRVRAALQVQHLPGRAVGACQRLDHRHHGGLLQRPALLRVLRGALLPEAEEDGARDPAARGVQVPLTELGAHFRGPSTCSPIALASTPCSVAIS
ncbi:uncharacterized protein LOC144174311 isoform X1 [Haemaphysalis longicornis]